MTTSELVKARLAHTRKGLDEALGRIDGGMLDWSPAPGMRTLGGQLIEIAGSELQVVEVLQERPYVEDDEVRKRAGDCSSLEALVVFLNRVRASTIEYIDGLSVEEMEAEVELKGWHESIGLARTPRSEILRSIAQHEAYHVGQIVSYLWARGDDPYKWRA
jgi:uncharacterized damage-inducible protein DinB